MSIDNLAIRTEELSRTYRKGKKRSSPVVVALDGVDLEVRRGELFGLLGPNGAGKTTLIKILSTLLLPTSGSAYVAGFDVVRQAQEVRKRINMVSGGEHSGYGILTVRETLWMFSQFYGVPWKTAFRRIGELLEVVGLAQDANTKINRLSTGMRQKMNFARGFMNDPEILFMDEPTLGLDVQAARQARRYIRRWVDQSPEKTVLLTTHYMAEAEELCDRVAIIDRGKILACDTPARLKRLVEREVIFHLEVEPLRGQDVASLREVAGVKTLVPVERDGYTQLKLVLERDGAIGPFVEVLAASGAQILSLRRSEPTLEDVFIELVGRSLEEDTRQGEGPT